MPRFEGCVEAREISLTRKGANQHAHVLIRKNASGKPGAQPKLETSEMSTPAEIAKAATAAAVKIVSMDDVTKSHFLGLSEDAQVAFLEKSAEDQKKEAEAAKAAADKAAVEAEATKAGTTAREAELQKTLETQRAEIDALKAARAEDVITKRAETEFAGYPGGAKAVLPLLKAYAKLPEDERVASEAVLKAQCTLAANSSTGYGARSEEVVSKAAAAKTRVEEAAKALAAEKKCSYDEAYELVIEKREFADDVAALNEAA